MQLEFINRIEIQGRVGSVKLTKMSSTSIARLTVATNHIYKATDGTIVEEVTWHTVTLWEGKAASKETVESIAKGDAVHIIGRLKNQRYTDCDGNEKCFTEILASQFEKLEA